MIRIVIFLALVPQILAAQTAVPIQSGEHEDFTRLVLTIDPDSAWELSETRGLISLTFPDQALDFNTSEIFARIPTTRLTAVRGIAADEGSVLEIDTPCACAAKVFAFGQGYLVIDILDGGPLADIVEQAELPDPPASYEYWQPEMLADTPKNEAADFFEAPQAMEMAAMAEGTDAEQLSPADETQSDMTAEGILGPELPTSETAPSPEMLARIEEAQDQLLQQLTRAADQGLIDFVPPKTIVPDQELIIEAEEIAAPEEDIALDSTLLNQLSARTAYDDAARSDLAAIINEFAKPQCLDNDVFYMKDWQSEEGFSVQVAMLRSQMFGEFDVVALDAVENLAKLYIVNGFGAEATALLADVPEQPDNAQVLLDMARVVDGGNWREGGPISLGENCGGDHEMWFLAGGDGQPVIVDTLPVIAAFSRYPIAVRLLIGPRLANTMLEVGEFDAAQRLLEIVRRAAPPETVPMQFASANLLESGQDVEAAEVLFEKVAMSQASEANPAIFALARAALAQEKGISPSLLTDLETIVFEQRETEIGDEARLLEIRVNARINGMAAGLEMITEDLARNSESTAELSEIVTELFQDSDADKQGNLAYVDTVLEYQHLLTRGESGDQPRIHVAEQLIAIGLPNIGLEILQPALERENEKALITSATAFLAQFEPDLALEIVKNMQSDAAIEIALSAYLLKSDHAAIAEILSDPANAEFVANDVAWRAGDWENIQGEESDATMAAFMRGQELAMPERVMDDLSNENAFLTGVEIDEEPNLQAARNLLDVNRASRAFIESVLAEE